MKQSEPAGFQGLAYYQGTVQDWRSDPGSQTCLVEIISDERETGLYSFRGGGIIESCEQAALAYCDDNGTPRSPLKAVCHWSDGRKFGPFNVQLSMEAKIIDPRQGAE